MQYILEIPTIQLLVAIGYSSEERAIKQPINIGIVIKYKKEPLICDSDNIEEGICYDTLTKLIVEYTQKSSFKTIEKLAKSIFSKIEDAGLNIDALLEVKITKLRAPVEYMINGVSFTYMGLIR